MKGRNVASRILRPFLSASDHERIFSKPLDRRRRSLIFTAGLARVFGREITCHHCGGPLGKGIVRVVGGRVQVWGLHEETVRVSFEDRITLRFSHVHAEDCEKLKSTKRP